MNTETLEVEIVQPVDDKLVKYASETGLEKQSTETLVEAFRPIFAKSRAALADARGVAESVKDATCVREIMRSRSCRLAIRAVRLESDEARKKHKQHALLYGRAVDGFHAILLADLSPVETALKEAEDFAERAETLRRAALKAAREIELIPLLDEPLLGNLADLSEADYMKKLSNAKLLRQVKLDAIAKATAERLAQEEAARAERERLAADNSRLQAEAVARESAAKAEREAAEKKLADERAEVARVAAEIKAKADADLKAALQKAEQERAAWERKRKDEQDAAFAAAEIIRKRVAAEKAAADAAAKAEREAAERKLAEERAEAERSTIAIKAEAARIAADIKAKADADAKEALEVAAEAHRKELAEQQELVKVEIKAVADRAKAAQVESDRLAEIEFRKRTAEIEKQKEISRQAQVEASKLKSELAAKLKSESDAAARVESERRAAADAAKKAAAATDAVKLSAFAGEIRFVHVPTLIDKKIDAALRVRIAQFCQWCENESERV